MTTTKPSASSATTTAFCSALLEGPLGYLWIDGNGKITSGNGTLAHPKPNAFSLVQVEDCPGSTPSCRAACYVHGLEKHAPNTHALYRHNSAGIRRILESPPDAYEWAHIMAHWINENCSGGFRWHVSGDLFSTEYARWIAYVCELSCTIDHWIYTRSFSHFSPLLRVGHKRGGNLAINLSLDRDNLAEGKRLAAEHGLRVCYLTQDGSVPNWLGPDDVIFPDYSLRGGTEVGTAWFTGLPPGQKKLVCPVDYGGKSEVRRCGPCNRCLT